jgi:hypothetical protein
VGSTESVLIASVHRPTSQGHFVEFLEVTRVVTDMRRARVYLPVGAN